MKVDKDMPKVKCKSSHVRTPQIFLRWYNAEEEVYDDRRRTSSRQERRVMVKRTYVNHHFLQWPQLHYHCWNSLDHRDGVEDVVLMVPLEK